MNEAGRMGRKRAAIGGAFAVLALVDLVALEACQRRLEADGLSAAVINARWAKPLDEALISEHAAGKRLVVTAEESSPMGGFGDAVLDALNREGIHVPVHKIALADGFVHHGAVDDLRRQQRIDAPGILEQVREAIGVTATEPARSKAPAA